ncbi:PEP-CTERM sorting domain-containing protein [Echinimonas agarilytica]|uniref:PEP-CTERM sorting domain-containing protein n=1 Tax=Echinimonas agarilytica TaxID=1215918 RepID=A0AA42B8D9_9GAMM|nr:PEP-CTERM sorting domain-containing protein [Echinimonas agarilytica]MCM2680096.1 PEP-CTERM sorting domain-containing protein [Echinimonas agarilytica]
MFKKCIAALALVATSLTAQADMIGGVEYTPGPFTTVTGAIEQKLNPVTGEFTVTGSLNTATGPFTCASCELTFVMGGYTLAAPPIDGIFSDTYIYTGGTIDIYVQQAGSTDKDLWLALEGHDVDQGFGDYSFIGNVNGFSGSITSLTGTGYLDVVGGIAADNFDTNVGIDGSDIAFNGSFGSPLYDSQGNLIATGSGDFHGATIPEPAAVALFGLGLLGCAAMARRRKA